MQEYYMGKPDSVSAVYGLLTAAWESKAPQCDFRLLKTCGFGTYGRGNRCVMLKKWGNTFTVGCRSWRGAVIPGKPESYYWQIWFISKPDRLHLLNHGCDQAAHNLLNGMCQWDLQQQSHRNQVIRNNTNFVRFPKLCMDTYYDKGLTLFKDGSTKPIGRAVQPEIVAVDKAKYVEVREALRHYWKLFQVYKRHDTLPWLRAPTKYNNTKCYPQDYSGSWNEKQVAAFVALHEQKKYDLSPKDYGVIFAQEYRYDDPTLRTIYRGWARYANTLGYSKIVNKGYTRALRKTDTEPNYVKLIGAY